MRLLIFGGSGHLGRSVITAALERLEQFEIIAPTSQQLDITSEQQIRDGIADIQPDVVLNCAAMTNVDDCERYPEQAFQINEMAPMHIAVACRDRGVALLHCSTDYVFDGEQDYYTELDPTSPLQVYGKSKAGAEFRLQQSAAEVTIVRLARLYSLSAEQGFGWPWLVQQMLRSGQTVRAITDETGHFTAVEDIAQALLEFMQQPNRPPIIHMVGAQCLSPYQVAQMLAAHHSIDETLIEQMSQSELSRPAIRPRHLHLQSKLGYLGGFSDRLKTF